MKTKAMKMRIIVIVAGVRRRQTKAQKGHAHACLAETHSAYNGNLETRKSSMLVFLLVPERRLEETWFLFTSNQATRPDVEWRMEAVEGGKLGVKDDDVRKDAEGLAIGERVRQLRGRRREVGVRTTGCSR